MNILRNLIRFALFFLSILSVFTTLWFNMSQDLYLLGGIAVALSTANLLIFSE